MPKLKQVLSIDKLLKNANVLQLGMGKNLLLLYIAKQQNQKFFLMKQRLQEEWANVFKNYIHNCNVTILNSFNPELQLKNTESVIKNE